MKIRPFLLTVTLAGLCVLPLRVSADDATPPKAPGGPGAGGGGGRMDPAERLKKMTEELSLTQDQQDKIKAIFDKYGPQFKEFMSKGKGGLSDDDKNKMRELFKTQSEEIAAVLTPEQQEKYKAAMAQRRGAGGAGGAAK